MTEQSDSPGRVEKRVAGCEELWEYKGVVVVEQKDGLVSELLRGGSDTRVDHQQWVGKWGAEWRSEWETVVEPLSRLSVLMPSYCLFTEMADMSVWQRQQKESSSSTAGSDTTGLADTTRKRAKKWFVNVGILIMYFTKQWHMVPAFSCSALIQTALHRRDSRSILTLFLRCVSKMKRDYVLPLDHLKQTKHAFCLMQTEASMTRLPSIQPPCHKERLINQALTKST